MDLQHGWKRMAQLGWLVLAATLLSACADSGKSDPAQGPLAGPPQVNGTEQFAQEVLKAKGPVLVDFYADWCGPCKKLGPALAELAKEHSDKLRVVKVNVDHNGELAKTYGVRGIPHMTLFRDGKAVDTQVGIRSSDLAGIKADLVRWLTAKQVLGTAGK